MTRLRQQGRLKGPTLTRGIPEVPSDFDATAQASWDLFAKLLNDVGYLSTADGPALALLAYCHKDLMAARAEFAKVGATVYTDSKGVVKDHPLVRRVRALSKDYVQMLSRFGLSPADRHRVSVVPPNGDETAADDPWRALH